MIPDIVAIAHPVSGNIDANLANCLEWYQWLVDREPNVSFSMSWYVDVKTGNDLDPERRERGLRDSCRIASRCDGIVLVGGRISTGMQRELDAVVKAGGWVSDLTGLGTYPPEVLLLGQSGGPIHWGREQWKQAQRERESSQIIQDFLRENTRLRELLWKTHRPTCKSVHDPVPCDCGAVAS